MEPQPGIRRQRRGKGWSYRDAQGHPITDKAEIARLNRIALPPAYTDAWFSPEPDAPLQATGTDARGRRQYRYHTDFRAARDAQKFAGCLAFGALLPKIRAQVAAEMARRGLSRTRALAAVVRLLDTGRIRVGNDAYARDNGSFGATTLRRRHAAIKGQSLHLRFRAKSGRDCTMRVTDKGLARFVRAMLDVPGQSLFGYVDDSGTSHALHSHDVNGWLHEITGAAITAKDFRTFAGSAIAFDWLMQRPAPGGGLKAMLTHVSAHLNNTPAIARKAYVHPGLIAAARDGVRPLATPLPRATRWLSRAEHGLMLWLAQQPV